MVDARKKYKVAGVIVHIIDSNGVEIESGPAVEDPIRFMDWVFDAKEDNPFWQGGKIIAKASGLAGNEVEFVLVIEKNPVS